MPAHGKLDIAALERTSRVASHVDWLDAIQWPAMAVTLFAAWLVASQKKSRREAGFWWFLASNVLWVAWGWHTHAWALIALQVGLFGLNLRGALKNDTKKE